MADPESHEPPEPALLQDLSRILDDVQAGRVLASDALLPLVYDKLRGLARQCMQGERADHTLDATALVHEAWLRLSRGAGTGGAESGGELRGTHADAAPGGEIGWENRAHFFGAAARAMRRILIEHARARGRTKRVGGRKRVALDMVALLDEADPEEVLAVDEAVQRLEQRDPRMGRIVQLRFYAGLSVEETAAALGVSERTVRREWSLARAWLTRELGG